MRVDRLIRPRGMGFGLALACALLLVAPGTAAANTFTVSNTHDSGSGSLRKAIDKANDETTNPGKDTIKITATGTIKLQSALPDITSDMAIVGPGASSLTVTRAFGAPNFRIFTVDGGITDSISGLSVKNGKVRDPSAAAAGGIYNNATLTLKSVVVAKNSAIATDTGGSAFGGGIFSTGSILVRTSRITDNEVGGTYATGSGIGSQGTLDLLRSTADRNTGNAAVSTYGGAIENSTIAENNAIGLLAASSSTTIRSSTIAANEGTPSARVNVFMSSGTAVVTFQNTIVSDPPSTGGNNCQTFADPTVTSEGHNLDSEFSCGFTEPGDRQGKDPKLGPLTNNGGPTPTMAIPKSSPATDKGDSFGVATDQRGKKRPVDFPGIANAPGGDGSDIGAFEIQ